jgi:hypothetical protein
MPSLCGSCKKDVGSESDTITCSGNCKCVFHLRCAGVTSESLKTRGTKKDWVCGNCKAKTSGITSESSNKMLPLTQDILVKTLNEFKKEVFAELQNYGKQFEGFKESMQMFSDVIDKANENMKKLSENYKELKNENQQIRAVNIELKEEVASLKLRMRQIEQYSRKTNIEIQGVPVTNSEDPVRIAVDVGKALGVELKAEDVMAAHRVPTFKPRAITPLIVQLKDRRLKDMCIAAYKKKKKLTAKDVNPVFPRNNVYVNDHLTPETKNLLRLTKMKAKEINYKYVWCNEGKIFVRSEDGQKCVRIDSEQDLCKLK